MQKSAVAEGCASTESTAGGYLRSTFRVARFLVTMKQRAKYGPRQRAESGGNRRILIGTRAETENAGTDCKQTPDKILTGTDLHKFSGRFHLCKAAEFWGAIAQLF
jgi:hypothetical protein